MRDPPHTPQLRLCFSAELCVDGSRQQEAGRKGRRRSESEGRVGRSRVALQEVEEVFSSLAEVVVLANLREGDGLGKPFDGHAVPGGLGGGKTL